MLLEKIITRKLLMISIKLVEKNGNWGNASKEEFLNVIKQASEKKYLNDKEVFDLTKRAMAI